MPFCTECGNSYPDEGKFCPHCGEPNKLLNKTKTPVLGGSSDLRQKTDISGGGSYGPHCGEPNKLLNKTKTPVLGGSSDLRQKTDISGGGSYGLSVRELPNGTTLENGRYTILEKLGEGGFGVVYKASDGNYDGRLKALKIIYSENYSDRLVMHKLKTEAKNMIEINHSNVVRLYDTHFENEIKFMDMEFIDGGDLVDLMLKSPDNKIPEQKVWELATQIAKGMQAIHQVNIIHQDLKPENILLTKQGVVKITDFGISETFKSSKSRIEQSDIKGTFVYASPEQLIGKNVGKESDVWSFGTTLYHVLTGETLYSGVTSNDIIVQIERREFEPILDLSAKMNALLTKCLKREYKERFRGFGVVLEFIKDKETLQGKVDIPMSKLNRVRPRDSNIIKEGFVFVENGSFQMGFDDGESAEKPVHRVTVSDFYIGKYEVTKAEWQAVMGSNPSKNCGIGSDHPVYNVSWYNAIEFCNKKSVKEGLDPCYKINKNKTDVNNFNLMDDFKWETECDFNKNGYRLPTEAEWEYAARGGNKSKGYAYSGSDDLDEVAEYRGNNGKSTKPVGGRKPNELGIYDMSGNVWEWCNDWYDSYSSGAQTDPVGPTSGSDRVYRGGGWYSSATYCRVARRGNDYPSYSSGNLGFRVARSSK